MRVVDNYKIVLEEEMKNGQVMMVDDRISLKLFNCPLLESELKFYLYGYIDGKEFRSSEIIGFDNGVIKTYDRTEYMLGSMSKEYKSFKEAVEFKLPILTNVYFRKTEKNEIEICGYLIDLSLPNPSINFIRDFVFHQDLIFNDLDSIYTGKMFVDWGALCEYFSTIDFLRNESNAIDLDKVNYGEIPEKTKDEDFGEPSYIEKIRSLKSYHSQKKRA